MLQRVLAREAVDERPRVLLASSGVRSYRQLVQRPLWDVAHAADLSVSDTTTLITKVSARLAPKSRTAFDMFLDSVNRPRTLRTGLPIVDTALCGGLHCGALHEFAGCSGIGKTQLAMTLAVRCALEYPDRRVLFIDTERGVRGKRLDQIARARLRGRFRPDEREAFDAQVANVLQRVLVQRVTTLAAFLNIFKTLERDVVEHKIQLIVVDSIAALIIKAHDLTYTQREHQLQRVARHLKYVGDLHKAFVAVTNRATSVENEFTSFTKPSLGDTWAHCVTSRFVLERHPAFRAISVVKCPSSGYAVQPFDISEAGVDAVDEPMLGAHSEDNDDDFDIHDDVLRELDVAGLPTVDPSGTLRSTQQSDTSSQAEHDPTFAETEGDYPQPSAAILPSDDFVSDSNDESGQSDAADTGAAGPISWFSTTRS